jgi:hypothetical protein
MLGFLQCAETAKGAARLKAKMEKRFPGVEFTIGEPVAYGCGYIRYPLFLAGKDKRNGELATRISEHFGGSHILAR